jgi:hypothetical protein
MFVLLGRDFLVDSSPFAEFKPTSSSKIFPSASPVSFQIGISRASGFSVTSL